MAQLFIFALIGNLVPIYALKMCNNVKQIMLCVCVCHIRINEDNSGDNFEKDHTCSTSFHKNKMFHRWIEESLFQMVIDG